MQQIEALYYRDNIVKLVIKSSEQIISSKYSSHH